MKIINYDTEKIRIIENASNIFFLQKEGLTVSALSGNIVFNTSGNRTYTYRFLDIDQPPAPTLDALVVIIRGYIDNA